MKLKCIVSAPISSRSGYGAHSRDIVRSLIKMNRFDISVLPTPWGNTPLDALDASKPEDMELINLMINPQAITSPPDIWIQVTIPNEFQRQGKLSIGITAGIECTVTRKDWIEGLNRMDFNIVTSTHSKAVFDKATFEIKDNAGKVTGHVDNQKPLEVLMEGIDLKMYDKGKPQLQNITDLMQVKEPFCFLYVGAFLEGVLGEDRKNVTGLIKTFLDTFKNKSDRNKPALILKTSMTGFSEPELQVIETKIEQIKEVSGIPTGKWPSIYVLYGDMTDEEIVSLYNHPKVKAMISLTKGEGYGRPMSEFTTTGKPVITSSWSGQLDFLNPEYSFLIPGKLTQVHPSAANKWIPREASWFTVDYGYTQGLMKDIYENYEKYLEKSRKHCNYTKENFSFDKMTEKFEKILNKYLPEQKEEVKFELPKLNLPKIVKHEI